MNDIAKISPEEAIALETSGAPLLSNKINEQTQSMKIFSDYAEQLRSKINNKIDVKHQMIIVMPDFDETALQEMPAPRELIQNLLQF